MYHDPFVTLLLITALAAVVPVLATRFRYVQLPIVVGEILAGMIIGRSGLNIVQPSEILEFLAEFGFVYLMFLSGLEVDMEMLLTNHAETARRPWWKQPLPAAFLVFAMTVSLGFVSALGLQRLGLVENPLLMGLILSTTSLGIVVPVLKERHLLGLPYGQALLLAALIADFTTLLLLTVAIAAISRGLTLDLLLILVLLAAFAFAVRLSRLFQRIPFWRRIGRELAHATAQIHVRGAFALMVAWVVLAEALGVEVILGAFLAGAIVSLMTEREESPLREKLDAIGYGFFIPIFFVNVGMNFNLQALTASPEALALVPMLIALAYLVKLVPALVYRTQFSWRETLAGGFLLSSRLSLIIAAAAIALDIGAISEAINAAVILVAVVTCTLSPYLFNLLYPKRPQVRREGVLIVGTDQMAELLARRLQRSGNKVVILGRDERRLETLRRQGFSVQRGHPADPQVLEQAGAGRAQALVAMSNDAQTRYQVCRLARQQFAIPLVVARVGSMHQVEALRALGVRVVQPALATVIALEGALLYPTAFDILVHQEDDVDVLEAVVRNGRLVNIPLRRLSLPGNALILSIRRGDSVLVPHGNTVLRRGDRVALIGSPESVTRARELLEGGA